MFSFNVILPELNSYLTLIGGGEYKGLIIVFFTISAAIARPFSGKISDVIGRKRIVYFGLFLCIIASFSYLLHLSVLLFLALRFLHGFSVGFTPTAATAMVSDILPVDRRGEGMGVWGTFISIGIGLGQLSSTFIFSFFGINGLFLVSSFSAIISLFFIVKVKESLTIIKPFTFTILRLKWTDIVDRAVLPPAIVMLLTSTSSGLVFVLSPDLAPMLGIANKGWFFIFYVLVTIIIRFFTGKLSDRIGREKTLFYGVLLLIVSMCLLTQSNNWWMFTLSSVFFGCATGINSPALFAWTADLSNPERRGVGVGTMFIALEFGIMIGAFVTLLFYKNTLTSALLTFYTGVFFSFISLIYLIYIKKKRSVNRPQKNKFKKN